MQVTADSNLREGEVIFCMPFMTITKSLWCCLIAIVIYSRREGEASAGKGVSSPPVPTASKVSTTEQDDDDDDLDIPELDDTKPDSEDDM